MLLNESYEVFDAESESQARAFASELLLAPLKNSFAENLERDRPGLAAPMHFRPATPADAPACVTLRGLTRENAISAAQLAAMGITAESWADAVSSGNLPGFVCVDDQAAIVGHCFGDKASGEVVVLALLPAYEGQGIGKQLLKLVVDALVEAGHQRLFLGCSPDPAVRSYSFYRQQGWVSTGRFDRNGDEELELLVGASLRP